MSEKIDADDIEVIIVWRNCPADIRDKLIAYWNEHNILTRPELIRQRLNTVVAVALHKSRIVGVWSAGIGPFFRDDFNFSIINTSTAPSRASLFPADVQTPCTDHRARRFSSFHVASSTGMMMV